jgi:hypothetical protein
MKTRPGGRICHSDARLPCHELELYLAVDKNLWRDWDPTGVAQFGDKARTSTARISARRCRLRVLGVEETP